MSILVKQLAVGSYFLQYYAESSNMIEELNRVIEREDQEDGEVVVKAYAYKKTYYVQSVFRTISSEQDKVKITPISQAQAYEWLERYNVLADAEKARNDARSVYLKSQAVLDSIRQYFIGEEQNLIEGSAT